MQSGGFVMELICAGDRSSADDALREALLKSALALVEDQTEADVLVGLAIRAAREGPGAAPLQGAELFRLLRRAYHSIERSRPRRPLRDAAVTSLMVRQAPSPTGEGG